MSYLGSRRSWALSSQNYAEIVIRPQRPSLTYWVVLSAYRLRLQLALPAGWEMRTLSAPIAFSLALTAASFSYAQLPPSKAGADHPLVGRFSGSILVGFDQKSYESRAFLKSSKPQDRLLLEGKSTLLAYQGPAGKSSLEVFRNYQKAMKANGFSETFVCENQPGQARACPYPYEFLGAVFPLGGQFAAGVAGCDANTRYATFRRGQAATVAIVAMECSGTFSPRVLVSVTEQAALDDNQIVVPNTQQISAAFKAEGKIALYGILFDTGKAELKPASRPSIDAIAAALNADPKLNLIIVGHTDNVGDFNTNVALSKKRADAVTAALVSERRIPPARLTAFGAGMTSPKAPNTTEKGRAENRRVELIPRQ